MLSLLDLDSELEPSQGCKYDEPRYKLIRLDVLLLFHLYYVFFCVL